eukprot:jgi/Bigna1/89635/estExt_fgenesh1_pg.C_530004
MAPCSSSSRAVALALLAFAVALTFVQYPSAPSASTSISKSSRRIASNVATRRSVLFGVGGVSLASSTIASKGNIARADDSFTTSPSGLQYAELVEGSGKQPTAGQLVKVHYTGWLNGFESQGKKFDSSRDRGRPLSFKVGTGQVIKGWDEGILGMKVGGRRRLIIPSQLAYGKRGAGGVIPPVELKLLALN